MPYKDYQKHLAATRANKRRKRVANPEKARAIGREEAAKRRRDHPERERAKVRQALRKMRAEQPERMRAKNRMDQLARRARLVGAFVETVDPAKVWKAHKGLCGICQKPVKGAWHVDHILPLARGGQHSYANVQVAHPRCNLSKGARS